MEDPGIKNEIRDFFEWVNKLNQIKLHRLCDYPIGEVLNLSLYNVYGKKIHTLSAINYFLRCYYYLTRDILRYDVKGDGKTLFFIGREIMGGRSDHLVNMMKVADLLKNRTVIYARRPGKITLRRVQDLFVPLIWSFQLREYVKERRIRWLLIYTLYIGYIQFIDLQNYERKSNEFVNVFILSDEHVSGQLICRYHKGRTNIIELLHGLNGLYGKKISPLAKFKQADYLLSYSEFATCMMHNEIIKYDLYKKGIKEVGNYSYIKENKYHTQKDIKRIGIYLDGADDKYDECCLNINLEMILATLRACKNAEVSVYVKCHPRATKYEIDYYKKNANIEEIYSTEKLSLELISESDIIIAHVTTVIEESVHQKVPTFVFAKDNPWIIALPDKMFFSDENELRNMISKVGTEEMVTMMSELKDYICGRGNEQDNYIRFFEEIGAC